MTNSEIQALLSSTRWSEDAFYLKEFVHKHKLPQVAKVVKGQYGTLGVSTLSSPSLTPNILLASAGRRVRVIAQCVKFKDGKKAVPVGPKLAIPESYEGFFEILSEDGKSVKCMENVSELARRFPDSVLVRENIKAFVSKSDDIESIQDKSRLIQAGETLILVGEVLGVKGKTQTRFLRCIDQDGENVFLPYDQKGKFSAIAKEENISGVHNIKNLQKKRLPLMVRLASGSAPIGLKSAAQFLPELRLLTRLDEEALVALPLSKDSTIVPLPLGAMLKLQASSNSEAISGRVEVSVLVERAISQMSELADRILVHDVSVGRDLARPGEKLLVSTPANRAGVRDSPLKTILARTGDQAKTGDDYDEIDQIYDYVRGFAPLPKSAKGWQYIAETATEERKEPIYQKLASQLDAENKPPEPPPIDTIPGRKISNSPMDTTPPMTPPFSPPWCSPSHGPPLGPHGQMIGIVPPPHLVMERPHSADHGNKTDKLGESKKRQRPKTAEPGKNVEGSLDSKETSNSRYVKASNKQHSTKHKFFRSRLKEKDKEVAPPPMCNLSSSTLYKDSRQASHPSFFNLRYKSLTNLAHQEYDTLDSSNSGGKTSFDSAGSRNVPEKRSRKLERPKSLTNLVWDFRSGGGTLMQRSNSKPSILVGDRNYLDPAGFSKRRFSKDFSPGAGLGKKMGSNKMATLYL